MDRRTLRQLRARRKLDYGLGMLEGAPLVSRAIASGKLPVSSPRPLAQKIALPPIDETAAPLPPSLSTLLAWDASWLESLGWFETAPAFRWKPRTLGEMGGAAFDLRAFSRCFALSENCVLVITREPDALGEYPVVFVDDREVPFLCVTMAGLDVYLGHISGVQPIEGASCVDIARDERFRARMDHHGRKLMKGRIWTEFPKDTLTPRPRREGRNPFNGQTIVLPEIPAGEVPIDWDAPDDD